MAFLTFEDVSETTVAKGTQAKPYRPAQYNPHNNYINGIPELCFVKNNIGY